MGNLVEEVDEESARVRPARGKAPRKAASRPGPVRVRKVGPEVSERQLKAMAMAKIARWKKEWPSTWSIPNIAQERFLRYLFMRPYPKDMIFLAGNGVGKSHLACEIMAGIVWGPKAVPGKGMHPDFEGMKEYEAWRSFRERAKAENRPIAGRIIAASDSLKGNGPMIQRVKRLFPKGLWLGEKNGNKYISEIYCWDRLEDVGDKSLAIAIIDVKTHMQDPDQHRGADLDFIVLDEPVPPEVYEECVGRTRANPDAIRIFTITPLEMSGWLIDALVEGADGVKVAVVYGCLWDNCRDWHPEAEKWSSGEVGVGHVITRGFLYRSAIDDMVDKWTRMSPDTVEARVYGRPTHLSGAVWKSWNPAIHMAHDHIPDEWEEWPIWNIIDPHHARPPAVIWVAQGPLTCYAFAEYPFVDYTKVGQLLPTLDDYAQEIIRLEDLMGISSRVIHRWGDPNSLNYTYAAKLAGGYDEGLNLQGILYNNGLEYNLANDNLRVGHEAVSEMLHYNKDMPVGVGNVPRLMCTRVNMATGLEKLPMVNLPNSMSRYSFKRKALETNSQPTSGSLSSVIDQTYKDFADDVRYFAISAKDEPFAPVSATNSLLEMIQASRALPSQMVAGRR